MVLKGQKLEVHDEKEPKLTVLMDEDLKQEVTDTTRKKKKKSVQRSNACIWKTSFTYVLSGFQLKGGTKPKQNKRITRGEMIIISSSILFPQCYEGCPLY